MQGNLPITHNDAGVNECDKHCQKNIASSRCQCRKQHERLAQFIEFLPLIIIIRLLALSEMTFNDMLVSIVMHWYKLVGRHSLHERSSPCLQFL